MTTFKSIPLFSPEAARTLSGCVPAVVEFQHRTVQDPKPGDLISSVSDASNFDESEVMWVTSPVEQAADIDQLFERAKPYNLLSLCTVITVTTESDSMSRRCADMGSELVEGNYDDLKEVMPAIIEQLKGKCDPGAWATPQFDTYRVGTLWRPICHTEWESGHEELDHWELQGFFDINKGLLFI